MDNGQKLGSGFSRSVALADLDGDGDLDVFIVEGSPFLPEAGTFQIWLNQGAFKEPPKASSAPMAK